MESHVVLLLAALLAVHGFVTYAHPADTTLLQNSDVSAEKRPKYMDTRELDLFKDLLLTSLREMAEEGQINPAVLPSGDDDSDQSSELKAVVKRMHYMGICMRRRHNTFIPYPCLRSG